jgi:gamma-glutamyltranspeptidase/glutathione hydrolase
MVSPAYTGLPQRPAIVGSQHVICAGHYLAAQAGMQVLEAGGNAVDATCAAAITICVVESTLVGFAGVAPMVIYMAKEQKMVSIDGLGTWPKSASCEFFQKHHNGRIPAGRLRSVVPGAPDAYLTALEKFGTMSFGDVASHAIRLARDGFAMYELMSNDIKMAAYIFEPWPSSAKIYLPNGKVPKPGERFVQKDLAKMLQYLADEEKAHANGSREKGLQAARRAFYKGDIAKALCDDHKEVGGLLTMEDMAGYRVRVEPPCKVSFGDTDVYGCGPYSQGPMLLQQLAFLEGFDLKSMGHNSAEYLHHVTEAIKISASDREAFYGDPLFTDVPMDKLLSPEYAAERRKIFDPMKAGPDIPPHGDIPGYPRELTPQPQGKGFSNDTNDPGKYDTSYACCVDRWGNCMSITPSCDSRDQPVLEGWGFIPSERGKSSWPIEGHPASVRPGKRPRMTPNPAMAVRKDKKVFMPFGTPGGDVQTQGMVQVFLNIHVFGMDPQTACEAPRVATYSIPTSFQEEDIRPGLQYRAPGQLCLESRIPKEVGDALEAMGHNVKWWGERSRSAGGVNAIVYDAERNFRIGGTDNRRFSYVCGW